MASWSRPRLGISQVLPLRSQDPEWDTSNLVTSVIKIPCSQDTDWDISSFEISQSRYRLGLLKFLEVLRCHDQSLDWISQALRIRGQDTGWETSGSVSSWS